MLRQQMVRRGYRASARAVQMQQRRSLACRHVADAKAIGLDMEFAKFACHDSVLQ
jgi:hypothetical protein